jgi:hypothetical protein
MSLYLQTASVVVIEWYEGGRLAGSATLADDLAMENSDLDEWLVRYE